MDIDAVINEKLNNDADFQATIADLPDEDKEPIIAQRKGELLKNEFEELSKKAQENEKKFNDQKIRAQKAEEALKNNSFKDKKDDEVAFSPKETIALIENKVSTEDFDEVVRVAKILGKPIIEALQDETMQTILQKRIEQRRSAQAAQMKGSPRGTSKLDEDALLRKAKTGDLPDTEEGMQALFRANLKKKLRK